MPLLIHVIVTLMQENETQSYSKKTIDSFIFPNRKQTKNISVRMKTERLEIQCECQSEQINKHQYMFFPRISLLIIRFKFLVVVARSWSVQHILDPSKNLIHRGSCQFCLPVIAWRTLSWILNNSIQDSPTVFSVHLLSSPHWVRWVILSRVRWLRIARVRWFRITWLLVRRLWITWLLVSIILSFVSPYRIQKTWSNKGSLSNPPSIDTQKNAIFPRQSIDLP